jgi:hypothetical protein
MSEHNMKRHPCFVVFGPGGSGSTDETEQARQWLSNQPNSALYVLAVGQQTEPPEPPIAPPLGHVFRPWGVAIENARAVLAHWGTCGDCGQMESAHIEAKEVTPANSGRGRR